MRNDKRFFITARDHAVLDILLAHASATGDAIAPILNQKLARADIVADSAIAGNLVTINSRVRFRIDGDAAEIRTLVRGAATGPVGMMISVGVPRGLAMLGMAEGETAAVARIDGGVEQLVVERILFQPQSASRLSARRDNPGDVEETRRGHRLTLVYSGEPDLRMAGRQLKMAVDAGVDNDPGPSAA